MQTEWKDHLTGQASGEALRCPPSNSASAGLEKSFKQFKAEALTQEAGTQDIRAPQSPRFVQCKLWQERLHSLKSQLVPLGVRLSRNLVDRLPLSSLVASGGGP